jgi:2-polyprenyl-3-methyl-5-hydroxy-6-metoxy-1,4-benzoquinol methylase
MLTGLETLARVAPTAPKLACRLCGAGLLRKLIDLGHTPLANRTVAAADTWGDDEPSYPLRARVCDTCLLVQIEDVAPADRLGCNHAFLSSRFALRLDHARRFATTMRQRLGLGADSLVIEIASNDGYLLRYFQEAGIPVLGIEPAMNAANVARSLGIPTEIGFFNAETAMEIAVQHGRADLVVADNVLSEVPDLFDFAAGFAGILRPNGVVAFQFPHVLSLLQKTQFDAFRHDRYSYLSLLVLERVLRSVGLRVFDAERIPDHGGSLRVYACHARGPRAARPSLKAVRHAETWAGLDRAESYGAFGPRMEASRDDVREFLNVRCSSGRRVAAYGAAARGNTLLNCCGVTVEQITCVADPDPIKHGRFLPGSHIPIVAPTVLNDIRPDDLIILPWPNAPEIAAGLLSLRQRGTQFWAVMPTIRRV